MVSTKLVSTSRTKVSRSALLKQNPVDRQKAGLSTAVCLRWSRSSRRERHSYSVNSPYIVPDKLKVAMSTTRELKKLDGLPKFRVSLANRARAENVHRRDETQTDFRLA